MVVYYNRLYWISGRLWEVVAHEDLADIQFYVR